MRRFRVIIATLVAVAMMTVGTAACTPEQQVSVGQGIANLFDFIFIDLFFMFNPPCNPQCPPDFG